MTFLANKGPALELFVRGGLVSLLARITKLGWFENPNQVFVFVLLLVVVVVVVVVVVCVCVCVCVDILFAYTYMYLNPTKPRTQYLQDITKDVGQFLTVSVDHCIIGLQVIFRVFLPKP